MLNLFLKNNEWKLITLIPFFFITNACVYSTPQESYRALMNRPVPESVTNITGSGDDFIFLKGYYKYNAPFSYFEDIKNNPHYFEEHEMNQAFREFPCENDDFKTEGRFKYWTEETVQLKDRRCFGMTNFPGRHIFIYDEKNQAVQHFVDGLRD